MPFHASLNGFISSSSLIHCEWDIQANTSDLILIAETQDMQVEDEPQCSFDNISIGGVGKLWMKTTYQLNNKKERKKEKVILEKRRYSTFQNIFPLYCCVRVRVHVCACMHACMRACMCV